MLVKEVMTKEPVVATTGMPLRDAVALLRKNHIGGLPVMEGDELAGMLTESDIIAQLETGRISDDLWLPSPSKSSRYRSVSISTGKRPNMRYAISVIPR